MNRRSLGRCRGVSLVIVMVLVIITGIAATVGLRASFFSTSVAKVVRSQALAFEAAEAALRYCEEQAVASSPVVLPLPPAGPVPQQWRETRAWVGGEKLSRPVPLDRLNSGDSRQQYLVPPECMIETIRSPLSQEETGKRAFQITARGFSPDGQLHPETGLLISGSEAWLQSTLEP